VGRRSVSSPAKNQGEDKVKKIEEERDEWLTTEERRKI
jgi:hypothetical protein